MLSGTDEDGRTYQWDRDVLTITANELGTFEQHDGKRLETRRTRVNSGA